MSLMSNEFKNSEFFSDIRYYSKVVSFNWFDYFLLVFWKSLLERFIVNLYVEGLDDTVTLSMWLRDRPGTTESRHSAMPHRRPHQYHILYITREGLMEYGGVLLLI